MDGFCSCRYFLSVYELWCKSFPTPYSFLSLSHIQTLGERWAAVCRWTEERWHKLQDVFMVWQQLLSDQVGRHGTCLSALLVIKWCSWTLESLSCTDMHKTVHEPFYLCWKSVTLRAALPPPLQSLFREWLAEKEEALSEVQTSNFKDPSEMNTNVRRLAVSRVPVLV